MLQQVFPDLQETISPDETPIAGVRACSDRKGWDSLVGAAPIGDVYYRPGYVRAYEITGHGRAIGLVIFAGESRFLVPLLLRPLSELTFVENVTGYDAATPYGYGGILRLSGDQEPVNQETLAFLFDVLREWCAEVGVVSILLRLHPLLQQEKWFSPEIQGAALHSLGSTVALDLRQWDHKEQKLATLRKGRSSDLNFARRHLRLTWALDNPSTAHEFVKIFRSLYEERMDQLQAGAFYYFAPEYYTHLTSGLGTDLDVAIAWFEDEPVGGSIFMAGQKFAHYHLSAATEFGRKYKASTLLINEGCEWALRRGCCWLHLGGGRNGSDSLFEFKQSFGGSLFDCSLVRFIADAKRYQELTEMRFAAADMPEPRRNFFPEYRA